MSRRLAGLALAAALVLLLWQGWERYGTFADLARLTGIEALAPLRPWMAELKMPLLAVIGFLVLSAVSWAWQRLGVGR